MKLKPTVEQKKLCTGEVIFHAYPPAMPGPFPLIYGEGKTEQEARTDLRKRAQQDRVWFHAWFHFVDWS